MKKAASGFAALFLVTLALAASCDRTPRTPVSRTPPVAPTPTPPPVAEINLTGNWGGAIGYSYYDNGFIASATLTQTGSSVIGTISCGGSCLISGTSMSGTVSGNNVTIHGSYPFGSCTFEGTISNDARRMEGVYGCSREGGNWLLTKLTTTIPEPPPCIPELLSPTRGVLLDNGRTDNRDVIDWTFDWTDCPGATEYVIVVYGPTATIPAIRAVTTQSSFRHVSCGYIAQANASNWRLWLRAKNEDVWGSWSPERNFDVERADSDPLSSCTGGGFSK